MKHLSSLVSVPSWFHFFALSSLAIIPVTSLGIKNVSGFFFLLIVFSGVFYVFSGRKYLFHISTKEIIFLCSVSALFFTALSTTLYLGTQLDNANRFLAMVLIIPCYIFFNQYIWNKEKYLWIGLVIGAYIALGISVYQVYGPLSLPRAKGVLHPILFGNMALVMGVMSLAGLGWFMGSKKWFGIFPILAFLAGMFASMLSLSRGGWVALPFFGVIFFWYMSKYMSLKKIISIFAVIVVVIGMVYIIPSTGVQKRVDTTLISLNKYLNSESVNDRARGSSIGVRFEMWKASWILFKSTPWTGVGWDQYIFETKILANKGLVHPSAYAYPHPHSQFLSVLAKGGIFAFLALLLLLIVPGYFFYRTIHQNASNEAQRAALAGLLLITGFICFGLSEAIFERSRSVQFFSFYLAVLMSMVPLGELNHNKKII